MKPDLSINIAGVTFKNPVIAASGTYGFGREYERFYPLETLGGVSLKGTTLYERDGNPPVRVSETPSGMLNSVGLQNPGADAFIRDEMPYLSKKNLVLIANVAGSTLDDYTACAEKLSGCGVHMIELNISCPNVKHGGLAFGTSCSSAAEVTKTVKSRIKVPLVVKLSPNVTSVSEIARAAEDAGADAVSLINTVTAMRIDISTRRPILKNNVGGLSGPAVFPIALRMVFEVFRSVKIPVIGMGGIASWHDAIEMMMAGAAAVQVGTAMFSDPLAPVKIINGIAEWMSMNGVKKLNEIVGCVQPW